MFCTSSCAWPCVCCCCCLFFAINASICSRAFFKPVLSCCLRRLRISYNVMSVLAWCTSSSICHASVFLYNIGRCVVLTSSEARGVPGVEPSRDVGPVELVRDIAGGVRILRPNLSKRVAEVVGEGRDEEEVAAAALRWSFWACGFVGRVLFALTIAAAAFLS